MKTAVLGLWHLGTTTAACLASAGHDVVGIDFDSVVVEGLSAGNPPLFEPGLGDLVTAGLASGRLRWSAEPVEVADAEVVWITYDTPVDDEDRADVEFVLQRTQQVFPYLRDDVVVLVSSQVPVGSTRKLEDMWAAAARGRRARFGYVPENLRLGKAITAFTTPDRIVVGLRSATDRERVATLLAPFSDRIEWMSVESAEMTKHALNAFLATSVTFINEIASICEQVGADAADVERGLKSEARIGPKAYLSPGSAFAGGALARDVVFLSWLGPAHGVSLHLLPAVKKSNDVHRMWAQRRLEQLLGPMAGQTVAIWGLAYKPGTDTLRRSGAVELGRWLAERGATVQVHDPVIGQLPGEIAGSMRVAGTALDALDGASALVVATPWPAYREVDPTMVHARLKRALVLDANCFLAETLGRHPGLEYISVGRGAA